MKKTIFISLVIGVILLSGCSLEKDDIAKEVPIIKNEEIKDIQKDQNLIIDKSENTVTQAESSQSLYRNNNYGFEFNYPSSWKIISEIENGEVESLTIKPKLYLKLNNNSDFKIRNFDIVLMIVSEEESKMSAGMVFNESTKVLENKNGEKIYINIIAESLMGGNPWPGKENDVKIDTDFFEKQWISIIDSIKATN